jgi:broad specificity phosphatase PhoE
MGWMEDMSYADLFRHMDARQLSVLDADVHGGESLETVAARCREALNEVLAVTQGPLIAVRHGYAIHALVEHRFGREFGLARIGNEDVVEIWVEGDQVSGPLSHGLARLADGRGRLRSIARSPRAAHSVERQN